MCWGVGRAFVVVFISIITISYLNLSDGYCAAKMMLRHTFKARRGVSFRYFASKQRGLEPSNWKEQWGAIERLRAEYKGVAPVDSMGAERLAKTEYDTGKVSEESFRFRTLMATMLSPQTKDQQTNDAFHNLLALVLNKGDEFLASSLAKEPLEAIEQCIMPVSFYKTKARNIHLAAVRIDADFGNDIPRDIDALLGFKGVGPKVAYLTFEIAWGKSEGICVDTHVHRIANRLGWVRTDPALAGESATKPVSNGAEKTRQQLELWLPRQRWGAVNELFVGFGQTICSARSPLCEEGCSSVLRTSCSYYRQRS